MYLWLQSIPLQNTLVPPLQKLLLKVTLALRVLTLLAPLVPLLLVQIPLPLAKRQAPHVPD